MPDGLARALLKPRGMRALLLLLVPTLAAAEPTPDKSGATATEIAFATTAVGIGTTIAGDRRHDRTLELAGAAIALIGPSAGHLYADEALHAIGGLTLRSAAVVALAVGVSEMLPRFEADNCIQNQPCGGRDDDDHQTRGRILAIAGGVTLLTATVYDLYDAHRAAARENRRVMIVPTILPGGAGLAISGRL